MVISLGINRGLPLNNGGDSFRAAQYVASDGNDSNSGLSAAVPVLSLAQAKTNSGTTARIAVQRGQRHRAVLSQSDERRLIPYGVGAKPIIDCRQSLAAKVWTLDSGTVYKTTVTLTNIAVVNGVSSNTFNPGLWLGDTFAQWAVGGANIAANIATVEAASGLAFTIHRTGSTVQDPRSDTAATGYDLYVKMADGSDPTGAALLFSDVGAFAPFEGGGATGVQFIGAHRKDAVGIDGSAYGGPIPTIQDCDFLDHGEHGWVGPVSMSGNITVRGAKRTGTTAAAKNRAAGAGVNIYTNTFRSTSDLRFGNLDISNQAIGFYGHGSSNQGYRRVDIDRLVVENVTEGIQFDVVNSTSRQAFLSDGLYINHVTFTDVDRAFSVDGYWEIGSDDEESTVDFLTDPLDPARQRLVTFTGTAPHCHLRNVSWTFDLVIGAGKARDLCNRVSDATHTAPILTLDNCRDLSASGFAGRLSRGGTANIWSKVDLRLINGTSIGDIMDQATGTNYPAALTVEAGCTFGMGDRTGPQIEAALTAASVPYTISHDTTIVNRSGTVLSSPGW